MNDGTQERTLDPPDLTLSDAEMRECERAARIGFDDRDRRAREWMDEQLADTPREIAELVRRVIVRARVQRPVSPIRDVIADLRDRYVAECAEEYWGDLIEQEKCAQEP